MKALLLAVGIVLLAGSLAACGSDENDGSTVESDPAAIAAEQDELAEASEITSNVDASDVVKTFPPTIVTEGDIRATKPDSPQRALLEWWQAFQFGDLAAVEDLTSSATLDAIGKKELADAVLRLGLSGIAILGEDGSGSESTVRVGLLNFQPSESGKVPKKPTSSTPEAFTMTKENGSWLFDGTDYLQLRIDSLG
jgi:hypothetical protein